jgi:hypothetical protein
MRCRLLIHFRGVSTRWPTPRTRPAANPAPLASPCFDPVCAHGVSSPTLSSLTGLQASRLISAALVAVAVAITTCFALVASDSGFRGGVARLVRCGAQRLDSTEALCHDHEHPGPVVEALAEPDSQTAGAAGGTAVDLPRHACLVAPEIGRGPVLSRPEWIVSFLNSAACGRAPPVS